VLDKYQFYRTARCVFPEELKDYDGFYEALTFMTGLRCKKICRESADTETSCIVRRCCRKKGLYACYKCDEFEECDKLRSTLMEELHADSSMANLREIREMGLEAWITKGKRHRYWDDVDDP
jgi:hypothetical protein